MIDPEFLLPSELVRKDVLTEEERLEVKRIDLILQKRNDVLLNFVVQKNDAAQRRFLECLRETDQDHVCNYINCDGGKSILSAQLRAGLTIVPVVPWEAPRRQEASRSTAKFLPRCFLTFERLNEQCRLKLNDDDLKKVVNFLGRKSARPEKIVATREKTAPALSPYVDGAPNG